MYTLLRHFPGFCAETTPWLEIALQTQQKLFENKSKRMDLPVLTSIVCRLGSCSSSSGNDVIFMPRAVKRFLPDRKFPPFSPRLKCNILFRAAASCQKAQGCHEKSD